MRKKKIVFKLGMVVWAIGLIVLTFEIAFFHNLGAKYIGSYFYYVSTIGGAMVRVLILEVVGLVGMILSNWKEVKGLVECKAGIVILVISVIISTFGIGSFLNFRTNIGDYIIPWEMSSLRNTIEISLVGGIFLMIIGLGWWSIPRQEKPTRNHSTSVLL